MIEASRRRRRDGRDAPFRLHVRLAAADAWNRRLTNGSAAAAVVSLVAWLAGAPLAWHAAAALLALAGGVAWPVRGARDRALSWIQDQSGLAYETALAHGDTSGDADRFGFGAALMQRASEAAARTRPPTERRWWIPLLVAAGAMLLLPAARLAGPGGPGGTAPGGPQAPAAVEPDALEEPDVAEPEEVPEVDRVDAPDDRDDDSGAEAEQDAPEPGEASEQETLSRFLDNLRERDPFQPVDRPGEEGDAPPSAPREGPGRDGNGEPPEGGEPGEGRPEQGESGEQDATGAGEAGEGEQQEAEGPPEAGGDQGEQPGEPGASPQEQGEQREGETPVGGQEPGEDPADQLDAEAGEGVGQGPSAPQPSEGAAGDATREPEFVEGRLGDGPENPGGSVLLPGEEEIDVPPELRSQEYRRRVEEAVIDGQVPLEYQEIIRNYFR